MQLHFILFFTVLGFVFQSNQLDGPNLERLNQSGLDLKICPRSGGIPSGQFIRDLQFLPAGTGRRTYCCLMLEHLLIGDTNPTDPVVMAPCRDPNREVSRVSRRSREGVSGFLVIFLDRYGRLWECMIK
ncbi:hypothetical protein EVAR_60031_1 [Eumeta japonica]|uniref:Uncharacterized protein n=1 Tax=Eumeta variegata TaxID=151549 RepID=A0A4C1ZHP2_EUMVA|nr:hypothetical protein EVAR_60031_1 [Eumeta japonica]